MEKLRALVSSLSLLPLLGAAATAAETPPPAEPLAGFSDGTAFLRSPDGSFAMFPNGRLQVDGYFFKSDLKTPNDTILLRRARLELNGWVGASVYYSIAGDFASSAPVGADPVAQSFLAATDDYVALAPRGDLAILQVGQFDAPFTLENRTSDKYFDFMERPIAVRAFGIPSNKELGAMLHGTPSSRLFYYSVGVLNGDGQNYKNADNDFDVMGRGWVAPLALSRYEALRSITIGGSLWAGQRTNGLPFASQSTQGGFGFLGVKWTAPPASMGAAGTPMELHQDGDLRAWALELNAPVAHKLGARVEYVHKRQDLGEDDVTKASSGTLAKVGNASLDGWAAYGEIWCWAVGDDRIIGDPGLQLPTRFKRFGVKPPQHGLMLAVRADYLSQGFSTDRADLADPIIGNTKVTSVGFGANYWYSKRYRTTFNYVFNHFDGDTAAMKALTATDSSEHELLFRFAIAL